jgi:hypothetical protein
MPGNHSVCKVHAVFLFLEAKEAVEVIEASDVKVLSLLGACFDLISGSSLSMKIQIMGGKITENLGFKSPLLKVNKFLFFFLFIFKFFTLSGYLLF